MIQSAEQRLADGAVFWENAYTGYFDPASFLRNAQASITAFRSVTWLLQAQKGQINGFDAWYGSRQQTLKNDKILKWLVDARNRIEKQGDLTTKSQFRVVFSNSWIDEKDQDFNLPPDTKPDEVLRLLEPLIPAAKITDESLLRFERRWVDSDLPDEELLSALVHCYNVLREILFEAHELLVADSPCLFETTRRTTNHTLPGSMGEFNTTRISWYKPKQKKFVEYTSKSKTVSIAEAQDAEKHYDLKANLGQELLRAKTFTEKAVAWFHMAQRMVEVDGYAIQTALIFSDKSAPQMLQFSTNDRADKHVIIRKIAAQCKLFEATSCIMVSEAWIAEFDGTCEHAVDHPLRKDALVVHGVHQTEPPVDIIAVFTKISGKVIFSKEQLTIGRLGAIMIPIQDAVRKTRR